MQQERLPAYSPSKTEPRPGPPTSGSGSKADLLRSLYDERLSGLEQAAWTFLREVENDELIKALREDPASDSFSPFRIREILEKVIFDDRERLLQS